MDEVRQCRACPLRVGCTAPVPGYGKPKSPVMLVGEAPGENEDRRGEPFVGQSGQLLWKTLFNETGLNRQDVYVTNVVKCRPPENRTPEPAEIQACSRWLWAEIGEIGPQIIVALGDTAAKWFMEYSNMRAMWGKIWALEGLPPLLINYHPAAALHAPSLLTAFRRGFEPLGQLVRGKHVPEVVDQWPNPPYRKLESVGMMAAQLGAWFKQESFTGLAFDTEAETDDEAGERIGTVPWSLQVSGKYGAAFLVPAAAGKDFKEALRGWAVGDMEIVLHNAMYDIPMLKKMGLDFSGFPKLVDSMVAADILQIEPKGLKELALRHAGMRMRKYEDVVREAQRVKSEMYLSEIMSHAGRRGWDKKRTLIVVDPETGEEKEKKPWPVTKRVLGILEDMEIEPGTDPKKRWEKVVEDGGVDDVIETLGPMPTAHLGDVAEKEAMQYACADADATLRVWPCLKRELEKHDLMGVFELDMGAMRLVLQMEENGMGVDLGALEELETDLGNKMGEIEKELEKIAGRKVNPGSPVQTAWLLFDHLKLPLNMKRGKERSTNDKLIEMMGNLHPAVGLVQDWRECKKLKSSYITPIREKVLRAPDGRLHARLKVTGTETGRMTANDPNVLSIPSRTAFGKRVKKAFVARPGCVIVNADFSQIEMRIFAHETQEPDLIQDYRNGADVHRRTAANAHRVGQDQVTDEMRQKGKTLNFGIIYGIAAQGLAVQLKCSTQEAQRFIDGYFEGYHRVGKWMSAVGAECRKNGFVRDMWGRIRWIGGINHPNEYARGEAERQACNAKIQSAASGFIKTAMVRMLEVVREYRGEGYWCDVWLQVHDALVFEVSEEVKEAFMLDLKRVMETARELSVPVKADVSWGRSWGEQTKFA